MKQGSLMLLFGGVILSATVVASQTTSQTGPGSRSKTRMADHPPTEVRGQRVFEQNCSRCHNAPEGFSTNISATIATHMRVRAGLSEADYKALLRYLNP